MGGERRLINWNAKGKREGRQGERKEEEASGSTTKDYLWLHSRPQVSPRIMWPTNRVGPGVHRAFAYLLASTSSDSGLAHQRERERELLSYKVTYESVPLIQQHKNFTPPSPSFLGLLSSIHLKWSFVHCVNKLGFFRARSGVKSTSKNDLGVVYYFRFLDGWMRGVLLKYELPFSYNTYRRGGINNEIYIFLGWLLTHPNLSSLY